MILRVDMRNVTSVSHGKMNRCWIYHGNFQEIKDDTKNPEDQQRDSSVIYFGDYHLTYFCLKLRISAGYTVDVYGYYFIKLNGFEVE